MNEQITKRRVTMTGAYTVDADGMVTVHPCEAVDYVPPDVLDLYVADARKRWTSVEVSTEPDAGPGGYHAATYIPAHLDHPEAGTIRPATTPQED